MQAIHISGKTITSNSRKSRKKYLATLANNLEDFCKDTSPETIHDLYKDFSTPVDTVNSYISTLTAENLIKRIQIGKYIRGGIITLIIILAVIASIFGITSYRSFQVFKQEAIYFTNTNIE